jgi:hypothetical protein
MRVWGIALLLKGEQGPVLDFEPFLKRGIKLPI